MAYRTIEVDGKNYQYVLGRQFLKVRGLGSIDYPTLTGIDWREFEAGNAQVTPKHVKSYIQSTLQSQTL